MAVLNPIRLVVLNYPEGQTEMLTTVNNPEDESAGTREIPFGRELWMEADDFRVDVNKKWFRLAPGRTVRLKSAYIVEYADHIEDEHGNVTEVHVNYIPNSRSGQDTSGVKPKGTLHWVAADQAEDAEVRLYDRLFREASPEADGDFMDALNPNSLEILKGAKWSLPWPMPKWGRSSNSLGWVISLGFEIQHPRFTRVQPSRDPQGRLERVGSAVILVTGPFWPPTRA